MIQSLLICYSLLSVLALLLYAGDKKKAKKKRWRIPEKLLLGVGFFGGAVGALLAMQLFRHKTRHWYFWVVNLLGLAWQVVLVVLLYGK
jgi:uncharacterized membrane protein YsdA (DUF1294 family)